LPKNEELLATAGEWLYASCHTIVKTRRTGVTRTSDGGVCALCGNSNVRFIHTLNHGEDDRSVQVGIDCAAELLDASDDYLPRVAENEVKRKEKWRIHYGTPGRCITTVDDLIERGKI
jgi:hypothetical protein